MNHCIYCNTEFYGSTCPVCGRASLPQPHENDAQLNRFLVLFPLFYAIGFSLLLFALYATPIATLFGMSCGNVYQIMSESLFPKSFQSLMILLIVIASISVFCSLLYLAAHIRHSEWARNFLSFIFILIYLSLIVVNACIIPQIGVDGELLAAGACPISVLCFSCIGVIQAFVAMGGRSFIIKRSPSLYGTI